jgi:hypothetical protein
MAEENKVKNLQKAEKALEKAEKIIEKDIALGGPLKAPSRRTPLKRKKLSLKRRHSCTGRTSSKCPR